jgi:hypothetical protein
MTVEPALSRVASDDVTLNVTQTCLHVYNIVDRDRLDATVRGQLSVEEAWPRSEAGDRVFSPMKPVEPIPPARRDET